MAINATSSTTFFKHSLPDLQVMGGYLTDGANFTQEDFSG
jgi:hypothetical protein